MSFVLGACGGEAEHRPHQPPTRAPEGHSASDVRDIRDRRDRPASAEAPLDAASPTHPSDVAASPRETRDDPEESPASSSPTSLQDEPTSTIVCDRSCVGGTQDGDDLLTPIDREHGLRPEWSPEDLIGLQAPYIIDKGSPPNLLRKTAATALVELSDAAFAETGVRVNIRSGYRPFALQCSIFKGEIRNLGCAEATRASARAGFSEHQLGTTADLAIGWRRLPGDATIDAFLPANAHRYGWVLSYPAGSEATTGYKNEPWHYRYLGPKAALDLVQRSGPQRRLSTQEYLQLTAPR